MWSMSKLNRSSLCTLLVQGTDQWSTNCTYNEIFSSLNQLHKIVHCPGGRGGGGGSFLYFLKQYENKYRVHFIVVIYKL